MCVLIDNRYQCNSLNISSMVKNIQSILMSKHITYRSIYFTNPLNAKIEVNDISNILSIIHCKGFELTHQVAEDRLLPYMIYLKNIICYNISINIMNNNHKYLDKCVLSCKNIMSSNSSDRNMYMKDIVSLINMYKAYDNICKKVDKDVDAFSRLYNIHKTHVLYYIDNVDRYNSIYVRDIDAGNIDERDIECIDNAIDAIGEGDEIIREDVKKRIEEFEERYKEYTQWSSSLLRKNKPETMKQLIKNYNYYPPTQETLDDIDKYTKGLIYNRTIAQIIDGTTKDQSLLLYGLKDVYNGWLYEIGRISLNKNKHKANIDEFNIMNKDSLNACISLFMKYKCYRKNKSILDVLEKLDILYSILVLFSNIIEDSRSNKPISSDNIKNKLKIAAKLNNLSNEDRLSILTSNTINGLQKMYNFSLIDDNETKQPSNSENSRSDNIDNNNNNNKRSSSIGRDNIAKRTPSKYSSNKQTSRYIHDDDIEVSYIP